MPKYIYTAQYRESRVSLKRLESGMCLSHWTLYRKACVSLDTLQKGMWLTGHSTELENETYASNLNLSLRNFDLEVSK